MTNGQAKNKNPVFKELRKFDPQNEIKVERKLSLRMVFLKRTCQVATQNYK